MAKKRRTLKEAEAEVQRLRADNRRLRQERRESQPIEAMREHMLRLDSQTGYLVNAMHRVLDETTKLATLVNMMRGEESASTNFLEVRTDKNGAPTIVAIDRG